MCQVLGGVTDECFFLNDSVPDVFMTAYVIIMSADLFVGNDWSKVEMNYRILLVNDSLLMKPLGQGLAG